jgi:hypothetical protein
VRIYSSRGFKIEKYGFFHGHAWPSKRLMRCDYLFMGHIQPAVEFKDRFGHRSIHRVWVVSKLNKKKVEKRYKIKDLGRLVLTIVPSFNELSGYFILNKEERDDLYGSLFSENIVEIRKSKVYFLDGTYLGELKNLY